MSNTTQMEPLPELKPAERVAMLEVDVFCVECGYNLHSQPVRRDENLGIFVCRCPECGRFHPAGTGITAISPWLRRLATILLIFWILIILTAIFFICMGLGAITVAHVETFSYRKLMTLDGREAEWKQVQMPGGGMNYQVVAKGTTRPTINNWKMAYTLDPPADDDTSPFGYRNRQRDTHVERIMIPLGGAALGLVTGGLMVVFLWHWKKRRYLYAALLPFAVATFMIVVFIVNEEFDPIRRWTIRIALSYALWEAIWMWLGTLIGRPVVRTMLRMFIPPKPRQHFACLWQADGKRMPATTPVAPPAPVQA